MTWWSEVEITDDISAEADLCLIECIKDWNKNPFKDKFIVLLRH